MRKDALVNNQYYHIFSRSIAKYEIFIQDEDYQRILELIDLYRYHDFPCKYSHFAGLNISNQKAIVKGLKETSDLLVEIIAYCLMPTHFHLILKQNINGGIALYMKKVLDGYSKYFNVKHGRMGPLWESRFKNVLIRTDEQLLHLTRYIHLNPVSAGLVAKPEDWIFSSYKEYIREEKESDLCNFRELFDLSPKNYKKFVLDRVDYQKQLSFIKNLLLDSYTG